jgi:AraC-like DNA-binding protein
MKIERKPCTSSVYCWNGISAMYYSSHLTPFHSHNNLQLIFDIQDSFKLRTHKSYWRHYKSLVIKQNVIHQLDTNKSVQLIIYIDPSLDIAEKIKSVFLHHREIFDLEVEIRNLVSVKTLQNSLLNPDETILRKLIHEIIKNLLNGITVSNEEDRIKQIKHLIQSDPTVLGARILATKVFLSESRLRTLFKQQTGISLHRYILLNRIIQSICRIMNGCNISDAALYSGFEDSSHLHKTMVKLFGEHPSAFINKNKELNIIFYDKSPLKIKSAIYNEQFILEENIVC